MKRAWWIGVIAVVVVAGIVFGGYSLRSRTVPAPEPNSNGLTVAGGGGAASGGGGRAAGTAGGEQGSGATRAQPLQLVAAGPVLAYGIDASGTITTVNGNGTLYQYINNAATSLLASPINNPLSASFSADGKKLVVTYGSAAAQQTSIFDIASGVWVPLAQAQNAAWAPRGHELAYLVFDRGSYILRTTDADAKKPAVKTIMRLHGQDLLLSWPSANTVVLLPRPSAWYLSSSWKLDLPSKTLSLLAEDQLGYSLKWNSSGTLAVAARSNENRTGGQMWLMDANGGVLKQFNSLTLPSKCAFGVPPNSGSQPLYCAIPDDRSLFENSAFPDAYLERAVVTADTFYNIDLSSGIMSSLPGTRGPVLDADKVSYFNNALYFVNRADGGLYRLSL